MRDKYKFAHDCILCGAKTHGGWLSGKYLFAPVCKKCAAIPEQERDRRIKELIDGTTNRTTNKEKESADSR